MLITGAARGFGLACVEAFLAAGWEVIATARTVRSPRVPGASWAEWDVTDDDTRSLVDVLGDRPLDVLVNNAARGTPGGPIDDIDVETLMNVCDVNMGGVLRAVRAVLPNLRMSSAPLVLNISSRLGSVHDQASGRYAELGTSYAYRISKAAQNMATVCLANELAPQVRVWAVHPGVLATGMGQVNAKQDPAAAADRLVAIAGESDSVSPRFRDLGGPDLAW